ncbi:MAG: glycosyltransferase [Candidatus Staskawiczbacteria bacterium]|nr:glycosyltransferase [Candidatus Staskawiczbacteria bacterium]
MKIALYYPWIYLKSGAEKTILEMVKNSRHEFTIFTNHFEPINTYVEYNNLKIIKLADIPVERSYYKVCYAAFKIIAQKISINNYDALIVASEGLGDFIVFRNHCPKIPIICYCHTPLKITHDNITRQIYLDKHQFKKPFFIFFEKVFRFLDKIAWRRYAYIFCNSQEVKNRILKARLAPATNIEILHPGVDLTSIKPTWQYDNYFLQPSRIKWYKNTALAVEAFKKFYLENQDLRKFKLIIASQVDKASKPYYEYLLALSRDIENIQIISNPDDELYKNLFQNAYAILHTTFNEDWGIVPLEAMAYGKPVIAVNQGGPTESIIDKETGFLVNPNAQEFSKAMKTLAEDMNLTQKIGKNARTASLKYDWKYFVKRMDSYFDSLLL